MESKILIEHEASDSARLSSILKEDSWLSSGTVIVNCMPDYSSVLCTYLNHSLSNKDLFLVINLEMPLPNMSQVYDRDAEKYELYDTYLEKWIDKHIFGSDKYLFVSSRIDNGRDFGKLKHALKDKIERDNYKFATLYLQEDSSFVPDYHIQIFETIPPFWWENK